MTKVWNALLTFNECPTLPAAFVFKESSLRLSLSKIMTLLLNKSENSDGFDTDNTQTRVSTTREKLLIEFKKIENDSKAMVAADILIFYIHVSFRYGWISRVVVGFLTVLSICPNAAKVRDGDGYLPIHLICNHKSGRLADMDVLNALLQAYPHGALDLAKTPFGDLNPLQMCLLSPQIHYEMIATIVRISPSSARVAFKGRFPLHLVLKNPAYPPSSDYDAMVEALQLMLDAHPRAAFLDIEEQSIQLRVAQTPSPSVVNDNSPAVAPILIAEELADAPATPSDVLGFSVSPQTSTEPHRLQISSDNSEQDDADSGSLIVVRLHLGHGDSDRHLSSDQHVTTVTWNPYCKAVSSSDPMLRRMFHHHAAKTAKNALFQSKASMKREYK